jgi:cell division protein YceG involved in septum cleavage
LASIIAAREPDSSRKELYFVLIPNSGGRHDFSKTLAEHEAKARKYGWK